MRRLSRMVEWRSESSARVPVAPWVALVVVFLAGMRGLVYRVRLQFGDVTGSFLDDRPTQVVLHVLYAVVLLVGLGAFPRVGRARIDGRVLMSLGSLCGVLVLSTAWSIDRGRTLNQSLLFVVGRAAAVLLVSRLSVGQVLGALLAATSSAVVLSVVAAALDWEFSTDRRGRLTGIFYNRNALGLVASLMLLSALLWWWHERGDSRVRVVAPLLAVTAIVVWWRSGSATSMIAVVAAVVAAAWLVMLVRAAGALRRLLAWMPAVLVVIVVAAVVWREWFADLIGRDATFTGRTSTWGLVIDTWARRPIVGFGYFAGWFDPELRRGLREIGYNHWEAHNGYLEVILGAGVLGAVALGWFVVEVGRSLWRSVDREGAPVWLAAFVFALVSNIGETNIGPNRLAWSVLVVASIAAATRRGSTVPLSTAD
ncbi:MAG: O-antigen ligase family protein [Actinomycetota bacterium]